MAYQPFVYSTPNVPTINPLEVVGTTNVKNISNTTSAKQTGRKIGELARKMLEKRKAEKEQKEQEKTSKDVAEEVANVSETENTINDIENATTSKPTEEEQRSTPSNNLSGPLLTEDNEEVIDDVSEGDIE